MRGGEGSCDVGLSQWVQLYTWSPYLTYGAYYMYSTPHVVLFALKMPIQIIVSKIYFSKPTPSSTFPILSMGLLKFFFINDFFQK
jgi:hypothetical protein